MKETLGEYIHELRIENGLTLTKLAAALDIDQSTLSKIENQKKSISELLLPKIAKVFNLDIEKLELEYYSEKIAEMIYRKVEIADILKLAEIKTKQFRIKKTHQEIINF